MNLNTINDTLSNLINSEGAILALYREKDSGSLFVRGLTSPGNTGFFCRTNTFILELYLKSRINLEELFLLKADEHFIIRRGKEAEAVFLEVSDDNDPLELENLRCGKRLFHLLSHNMRPDSSVADIIQMIPDSDDKKEQELIEQLTIVNSQITLFDDVKCPLSVVSIEDEELNYDEHDFIEGRSPDGKEKILTKINPMALKLFATGRITVSDLFKLRQDDSYYIVRGNSIIRSGLSKEANSIIENLSYADCTYFALPTEFQLDAPLEAWNYYQRCVINGKGILPWDFNPQFSIDLTIH